MPQWQRSLVGRLPVGRGPGRLSQRARHLLKGPARRRREHRLPGRCGPHQDRLHGIDVGGGHVPAVRPGYRGAGVGRALRARLRHRLPHGRHDLDGGPARRLVRGHAERGPRALRSELPLLQGPRRVPRRQDRRRRSRLPGWHWALTRLRTPPRQLGPGLPHVADFHHDLVGLHAFRGGRTSARRSTDLGGVRRDVLGRHLQVGRRFDLLRGQSGHRRRHLQLGGCATCPTPSRLSVEDEFVATSRLCLPRSRASSRQRWPVSVYLGLGRHKRGVSGTCGAAPVMHACRPNTRVRGWAGLASAAGLHLQMLVLSRHASRASAPWSLS
mmetsp:Transcript_64594/g.199914  ORF Transcript_64594/g.199914 Transcript_64594/m.199914 type:complete len:327 (-) Transcript_64594:194-1174(-)